MDIKLTIKYLKNNKRRWTFQFKKDKKIYQLVILI